MTGLIRENIVNQIEMNGEELLILCFSSAVHLSSLLLCISYKTDMKIFHIRVSVGGTIHQMT